MDRVFCINKFDEATPIGRIQIGIVLSDWSAVPRTKGSCHQTSMTIIEIDMTFIECPEHYMTIHKIHDNS